MALVIGIQGPRTRYLWNFPGTEQQLRVAWGRCEAPAHVTKDWGDSPKPEFEGTLTQVDKLPGDLEILAEFGNLKEAVLYIGDDSIRWPRQRIAAAVAAKGDDDDDDDDDEADVDEDDE